MKYGDNDSIRYELLRPSTDGLQDPTSPNSGWARTERSCTEWQSNFPYTMDLRIRRFSIWTNKSLSFNDRVQAQPWWVGSNAGPVYLGVSSHIVGNVRVGGDFVKRTLGNLYGEVWYTDTLTQQTAGGLDNAVKKDALTYLNVALPKWIYSDSNANVFAQPDQVLDLPSSASYGAVTVNSRATLVLHGGDYSFTQLNVEPSATIRVEFDGSPLRVHVRDAIDFKQDAKFDLVGGDASDLLWMLYGTGGFHLGSYPMWNPSVRGSAGFHGTLIAPKSSVSIASDGAFTGTIYADAVEIHQGNRFMSFIPYDGNPTTRDSDGDGLEDSTELRIGSDPRSIDTDEDGLSDALELWGRGTNADGTPAHRFGAEYGMKRCRDAWATLKSYQKKPCHFVDGYIPPLDANEFLNPTRRDVALRLFWEPESAFWRYASDPTRFGSGRFEECYADSEANHALAASFNDVTHFHPVPDSDVVAIPYLNVALHLDAGTKPGASVNMPPEVELMGGEHLVASGGADTGTGLWNYDHPEGSNTISNRLSMVEAGKTLQGMGTAMPHSRSFWDIFHYGFMTFDNNQKGYGMSNGLGADYFYIGWKGVMNRANVRTVMHEFGHNLNLPDLGHTNNAWIYEGVMNYAYPYALGCTPDKWDPLSGKGSVDNKRWCGEMPTKGIVPQGYPRAGQDWYLGCDLNSPFMLQDSSGQLAWTCGGAPTDYGNRAPIASDIPVRTGEGPLNLATGYRDRYPIFQFVASDLTYSHGRLCTRVLTSLVESKGLGICKERRGHPIPETTFGAIDFNGNGVIDSLPVDIWTDKQTRRRWLWDSIPEVQKDVDEWGMIRLASPDNILNGKVVGIHCTNHLIWDAAKIAFCKD